MTVRAAMLWNPLDPVISLHGRITPNKYDVILQDQVQPLVLALLPNDVPIFQDRNPPMRAAKMIAFLNNRMTSAALRGLPRPPD